jgi:hypothetical protein
LLLKALSGGNATQNPAVHNSNTTAHGFALIHELSRH